MTDPHDDYYRRQQAHRAELFNLQLLAALLHEHADCWPAAALAVVVLFVACLPL